MKDFLMELFRIVLLIIFCHVIGDYVFRTNLMEQKRGEDAWVFIVHCLAYCVPFYICFGMRWQLALIFIIHLVVDYLSCWRKVFGTFFEQYFLIVASMTYIFPVLANYGRI